MKIHSKGFRVREGDEVDQEMADKSRSRVQNEGWVQETISATRRAIKLAAAASVCRQPSCRPADLSGDGCGGKDGAIRHAARPSSELRTRLKRLLEMDRRLGRNARSADPELANFAFYSSSSPGKGVEVWFSGYEAFALLIGLRLLGHGWPQSFPVAVMRRIRPDLETAKPSNGNLRRLAGGSRK